MPSHAVARLRPEVFARQTVTLDRFSSGRLTVGVGLGNTPGQKPSHPDLDRSGLAPSAPRRRAARWGGFAPASDFWPEGVLSVDDYRAIAADIVPTARIPTCSTWLSSATDGTLPAVGSLEAYAAAGVTWLLEQALTPEEATARSRRGPPVPG